MKDPLNDILNKIESEYQTTNWPTIRYEAKQALNAYYLSLLPEKSTENVGFTVGKGRLPLTQFQLGYNQAIDEMKNRIKGTASLPEDE